MNSHELHAQIEALLEQLAALNFQLSAQVGEYPKTQTDLFKAKTLELYDAIHALQMDNWRSAQTKAEHIIQAEPLAKTAEIVDLEEKPTQNLVVEESNSHVGELKIPSPYDAPKFVPVVEKPIPKIEAPQPAKPIEKSLLDKMNESKSQNSLHEILVSTSESDEWSDRFAKTKITKIKDAIDISKRFEIQSNLFEGDANAYVSFINSIESADGLESALEQFKATAIRYHWNAETELVMELKSFIYRKY